jgi:hypothetical protein
MTRRRFRPPGRDRHPPVARARAAVLPKTPLADRLEPLLLARDLEPARSDRAVPRWWSESIPRTPMRSALCHTRNRSRSVGGRSREGYASTPTACKPNASSKPGSDAPSATRARFRRSDRTARLRIRCRSVSARRKRASVTAVCRALQHSLSGRLECSCRTKGAARARRHGRAEVAHHVTVYYAFVRD